MTEWINGLELLDLPYNLTKRDIFKAVQSGSLVPYMSPDSNWIKKYEILEPDGERIWRVFPTPDLQKEWVNEECLKPDQLTQAKEWSLMSDEEIISHQLNLYKAFSPPRGSEADPAGFVRSKLPEIREKFAQKIKEFPSQIKKAKEELAPNRVWKDLDLGPAQQELLMGKLLDAFYPIEQVESFSGAKFEKQSVAATKSQEAKSYAAKIKEAVRAEAQTLWEKTPTITIEDMAYRDELNNIAIMKNGSVYSEVTIKKWIKDLCPNRKPGRRPKK